MKSQIPMKSNTYQVVHDVKGCKEKKHLVIGPLTDPMHLQKDRLEKEKKQAHAYQLSGDHHEEMGPISHLSHQPDLDQKAKEIEIATKSGHEVNPP
jgi:hypothetical protein